MAHAINVAQNGNFIADRVRSVIASISVALEKRNKYFQTLEELSSLSDRELADLGLSRWALTKVAREHVYGK